MGRNIAIIGAGVGGLACAIRLAAAGHTVSVFEKNEMPGGKMYQVNQEGFRFDTGPSLLTMPEFIFELLELAGNKASTDFQVERLDTICKYFYADGTILNAYADKLDFAKEVEARTKDSEKRILAYLKKSRELYELASEPFIYRPFHSLSVWLSRPFLKAAINVHKMDTFNTMHHRNAAFFNDPKIVQLFDRYATYNGSNPYLAPATLNIIAHLEHNLGAFFPKKGIYSIADTLASTGEKMGVNFFYNSRVGRVNIDNNRVTGIRVNDRDIGFDIVVNNIDIFKFYQELFPGGSTLEKTARESLSTSALIFYWGVKGEYPGMELHNILFAENYRQEFEDIFTYGIIHEDPTVYIFISSKLVHEDAPGGCENWFVMINTPPDFGQDWDSLIDKMRSAILKKILKFTGIDLKDKIIFEHVADPRWLELRSGAFRGALYGYNSNRIWAAFNRHPNKKRNLKGIYFVGGTVHPGGGIPLCLSSAKIVANEINNETLK